jgi:hypothetical protein
VFLQSFSDQSGLADDRIKIRGAREEIPCSEHSNRLTNQRASACGNPEALRGVAFMFFIPITGFFLRSASLRSHSIFSRPGHLTQTAASLHLFAFAGTADVTLYRRY